MLASPHLSDRAVTADTECVSLDTAEERWAFAWERRGPLLAYARRLTTNPQVAADALAYALLEAGRAKARTPGALCNWLKTCVRREVAREERGRGSAKSRARYANTLLVTETDTARLLDEEYESALMLQIVASLPPHLRRMFTILGEGGSARDVATEFGMTVKAVECLIWRTRRWCRMEFAKAVAACPTPALARLARRRPVLRLLPALSLLVLAVAVVVLPTLPTPPTAGNHASAAEPSSMLTPRPSATPTPPVPRSDRTPLAIVPGLLETVATSSIHNVVSDRLPTPIPTPTTLNRKNDGDRDRTMHEEAVLCVERVIATLPPRSLPCQPER